MRCGWWMVGILVGGLVIRLVLVEVGVVVLRFSVGVLVSLLLVVIMFTFLIRISGSWTFGHLDSGTLRISILL